MLGALLTFLIGCLVLVVILYTVHVVIGMLTLPAQVKQIALLIIGLIGLIALIMLAMSVFRGGVPTLW